MIKGLTHSHTHTLQVSASPYTSQHKHSTYNTACKLQYNKVHTPHKIHKARCKLLLLSVLQPTIHKVHTPHNTTSTKLGVHCFLLPCIPVYNKHTPYNNRPQGCGVLTGTATHDNSVVCAEVTLSSMYPVVWQASVAWSHAGIQHTPTS